LEDSRVRGCREIRYRQVDLPRDADIFWLSFLIS
jgi:hypothetical protein